MTLKEIVNVVAEKNNINKQQATNIVNSLFDLVIEETTKGDKVVLPIGILKVAETKERKGRNPQTGQEITIPAKKAVKFTVSKRFKDLANESK